MTPTKDPSPPPAPAPQRRQAGFTLIEVMIVVVIIGVIAAIAYPSYQDSVRKSRRSDAKAALSDAAARLENFYQSNKSYTRVITDLGYSNAGSNDTLSPEQYYLIDITVPADGDACIGTNTCTAFTLRAVAQAKGKQDQDTVCATMTLNHKGAKTPASGCW